MAKFTLRIKDANAPEGWDEFFDRVDITTQAEAEAWGKRIIKEDWNDILAPGHLPREFVSATITGPSEVAEDEDWYSDDDDLWDDDDDEED